MGIAEVNFNGMTEFAMTVKRLRTFYKQRELCSDYQGGLSYAQFF